MDNGGAADGKCLVIDRMGHEAGDARRDGSRRLEGHFVEMGLGKNRISGEGYISSRLRHHEAGTTAKFPNQARALLCR